MYRPQSSRLQQTGTASLVVTAVPRPVKWVILLIFLECFVYRAMSPLLTWEVIVRLTPDRVLFLILLAALTAKAVGRGLGVFRLGRTEALMFLFACTCTLSYSLFGREIGDSLASLTTLFDFIFVPLTAYLILKAIPHSQEKLQWFLGGFAAIGAYLAINGWLEHFGFGFLVWPGYILDPSVGIQFGRTRGSFASSAALGGAMVACFLVYSILLVRSQGARRKLLFLMLALTAGTIYFTYQRSSWLAFGAAVMILAAAKTNLRRVSAVIAVLVLGVFITGVGTKFSLSEGTLFGKRKQTIDYRLVNYLTTYKMFRDNPVMGIGYGNFRHAWPLYVTPIPGMDVEELSDGNHNTFLGILAEVGLIGFVLYMGIFYQMLRQGHALFRKSTGMEKEFALIFLTLVICYMIDAVFSDFRSGQFLNTTLYAFFGMAAAQASPALKASASRNQGSRQEARGTEGVS